VRPEGLGKFKLTEYIRQTCTATGKSSIQCSPSNGDVTYLVCSSLQTRSMNGSVNNILIILKLRTDTTILIIFHTKFENKSETCRKTKRLHYFLCNEIRSAAMFHKSKTFSFYIKLSNFHCYTSI
jgi:hypothetical protein